MQVLLKQKFTIESARFLPKLPTGHPCSKMHGHSFVLVFSLLTDVDESIGWGMDYHQIKTSLQPLLAKVDHKILNEIPGLENPTSEHLAAYLYREAKALIPAIAQVSVSETSDTECVFPAQLTSPL